jgi:hypothetical protein
MNERIKQLELLCYEECGDYHLGSIRQLNVEKFAELIVRECAEVITETRWHLPPTQQQIAIGIKEHFGVNE